MKTTKILKTTKGWKIQAYCLNETAFIGKYKDRIYIKVKNKWIDWSVI